MIYGLVAALGWGVADILVALVARRIGSFVTVVVAQLAGILLFSALLLAPGLSLPPVRPALAGLLLIGILGALSYVAFYRGLELGPISLVTPIAAGYAAVVIVLSLLFLKESVSATGLAGAAVTIGGVALASASPRAPEAARRPAGRGGVFYALLAMLGFGVSAFLVGIYSKDLGWFPATYVTRLASAVTLLVLLAPRRRLAPIPGWFLAGGALIGVLDIFGFASFARGSELGFVSITAAASVAYPTIPILVGVAWLHERPARRQWGGVVLVAAGLVLLALGE